MFPTKPFIKLVKKDMKNKYILVVIEYATKWIKAKTLKTNMITIATKFNYDFIFIKFGWLFTLLND